MDVARLDGWAMARKKIVRESGDDVREHPRYSVDEAADYLGIPSATLYRWVTERDKGKLPLIMAADEQRNLLSFYNLVEAYVLVSVRRRGVSLQRMQIAVQFMRERIGGPHPLATYKFATVGKNVFVEKLEGQTVDAGRYGQPALGDILDKYLRGITRGRVDKMPVLIRPLHAGTLKPSPVVISPFVSSGSPVIKGTGIIAATVWKRAKGGESVSDLAHDYDLKPSEIETVIKYFDAAA
jgi:uncharacterized protein (DUF433 family)/transposase-like protein